MKSLQLRLDRTMDENTMLCQIGSLLYPHDQYNTTSITTIKVQLLSYYSSIPFELTKSVTDALIKYLRGRKVDFHFDFIQDNVHLKRLLSSTIRCTSLKILGLDKKKPILDYIGSSHELQHLQLTIRASETTASLLYLSNVLKLNSNLQTLSICSYHEAYPDAKILLGAIHNHPTLYRLQIISYQYTLKRLCGFQFLPQHLNELDLSALSPFMSNHPTIVGNDNAWYEDLFSHMSKRKIRLKRLGICNMDLTGGDVDTILCSLPSDVLYLDLYGHPSLTSLYFPKFQRQLQERPAHCLQLRELNSPLNLLLNTAEFVSLFDYLHILFSKNPSLYRFGGHLEHLPMISESRYQELLFLADWNRSGARKLLPLMIELPASIWPSVLERTGQHHNSIERQASVLKLLLQESSSQILVSQ